MSLPWPLNEVNIFCNICHKLVWKSHQVLGVLSQLNRVPLRWVPGQRGFNGHEKAIILEKEGVMTPFTGLELASTSRQISNPLRVIGHQRWPLLFSLLNCGDNFPSRCLSDRLDMTGGQKQFAPLGDPHPYRLSVCTSYFANSCCRPTNFCYLKPSFYFSNTDTVQYQNW